MLNCDVNGDTKILTSFEGKMSTSLVRLSLLRIRPRVQRGRDFF